MEKDISRKQLGHRSFYVLALSVQKTLNYNFCCNVSDQFISFLENEILSLPFGKKINKQFCWATSTWRIWNIASRNWNETSYFPHVFPTNCTSQFAFWEEKILTPTKDLKIQQLHFSNTKAYRFLREITLVITMYRGKSLDDEWERY